MIKFLCNKLREETDSKEVVLRKVVLRKKRRNAQLHMFRGT